MISTIWRVVSPLAQGYAYVAGAGLMYISIRDRLQTQPYPEERALNGEIRKCNCQQENLGEEGKNGKGKTEKVSKKALGSERGF
jgi:hypothetical protein